VALPPFFFLSSTSEFSGSFFRPNRITLCILPFFLSSIVLPFFRNFLSLCLCLPTLLAFEVQPPQFFFMEPFFFPPPPRSFFFFQVVRASRYRRCCLWANFLPSFSPPFRRYFSRKILLFHPYSPWPFFHELLCPLFSACPFCKGLDFPPPFFLFPLVFFKPHAVHCPHTCRYFFFFGNKCGTFLLPGFVHFLVLISSPSPFF